MPACTHCLSEYHVPVEFDLDCGSSWVTEAYRNEMKISNIEAQKL